jgi:hypothetical protein
MQKVAWVRLVEEIPVRAELEKRLRDHHSTREAGFALDECHWISAGCPDAGECHIQTPAGQVHSMGLEIPSGASRT